MERRTKEVFLNPRSYTYPPKDGVFLGVAPLSGDDVFEVPDYSPNDADRRWFERELGDCPPLSLDGINLTPEIEEGAEVINGRICNVPLTMPLKFYNNEWTRYE